MNQTLNPSSRPRRGALAVLGGGVVAALVGGALVIGGSTAAGASGLSTFESCAELRQWAETASDVATEERFEPVGAEIMADGADSAAPAEASAAGAGVAPGPSGPASTTAPMLDEGQADDGEGGAAVDDTTNVIVEGIDEPDLVERLGGDRVLVVGGQTLAVADLASASMVSSARVPWGAQITYDAEAGVAWSVGYGDMGETLIQRFVVGADAISEDGSWSTRGQLVSARRQGAELLVVATDGFSSPVAFEEPVFEGDGTVGDDVAGEESGQADPAEPGDAGDVDDLPFGGDVVPCDQVLHPTGPAQPTSTLLVVLPVDGPLEPVRSTQVVGSGANVHVTADAAYLATPTWDETDGTQSTGLHRFDLGSLVHTGSGAVEGSLLNDWAISEYDGHLRVAVTVGGGGFIGIPMPVDGGIGDGRPLPVEPDGGIGDGSVQTTPAFDPNDPTTAPAEPTTAPAEPTTAPAPAPTGDTSPGGDPAGPETTTTIADPSASVAPGSDGAVPPPDDPIGTIVEDTIPVDPFPMPTVVEPGPDMPVINEIVVLDIDGDLDVVGRTPRFGHPGERLQGIRFEGDIAYAVTFLQTDPFYVVDLADPANPTILGELELPGFSAYLHPISATEVVGFGPDESGRASAKLFDVSDRTDPRVVDSIVLGDDSAVVWDHHAFASLGDDRFAVPASNWIYSDQVCIQDPCESYSGGQAQSSVVVLAVSGGRLVEEERITVALSESIARVIPASDGWGLLASQSLTVVDGDGSVRGTVPLG